METRLDGPSFDKPCTPSEQPFAGRLRSNAAYLASNYENLSAAEAQVLVRALESAADHVEAFFARSAAALDLGCDDAEFGTRENREAREAARSHAAFDMPPLTDAMRKAIWEAVWEYPLWHGDQDQIKSVERIYGAVAAFARSAIERSFPDGFIERCNPAAQAYVSHCRRTLAQIDKGVLQDGYRKVCEMALSRALDFQQEVLTMLDKSNATESTVRSK